jgi:hypothetical protein
MNRLALPLVLLLFLALSGVLTQAQTTYTGKPTTCQQPAYCSFTLSPKGGGNLFGFGPLPQSGETANFSGSGQFFLPGYTHWDYLPANAWSGTVTNITTLTGGALYHIVGSFNGTDETSGDPVSGKADYYVYSYPCHPRGTCFAVATAYANTITITKAG